MRKNRILFWALLLSGLLALLMGQKVSAYGYDETIDHLVQTGLTKDSITIEFETSGLQKVTILVSGGGETEYREAGTMDVTDGKNSYTITGLKEGTRYSVKVKKDTENWPSKSQYEMRTKLEEPQLYAEQWYKIIKKVSFSEKERSEVVDNYEYQFCNYKKKVSDKGTCKGWGLEQSIENNQVYYLRFRANAKGIGEQTYKTDWFETIAFCQPDVKNASLRKAGGSNKGQMTVQWEKQKGVAGYEVYISQDKNADRSTFKKVAAVGRNQTRASIKKLDPKKTYYVLVQSVVKYNGAKVRSGLTYCWKVDKNGFRDAYIG